MNRRLTITLPEETVQLLNRIAGVVSEAKATTTDAVLPVAGINLPQCLDGMASRTVVRIGMED